MARRASTLVQQSRRLAPETKARIHQIDGAGTRGVLRRFLGLTPDEILAIGKRLDEGVRRNVGRTS